MFSVLFPFCVLNIFDRDFGTSRPTETWLRFCHGNRRYHVTSS